MGAPGIVAGCFGKLPLSADFIGMHASDSEASAFDRWLREGVGEAHARADGWEERFRGAPAHRFIYWSETPDRALAGVLVPSRDAAGRLFPFAAFYRVESRAGDGRAADLVRLASSIADGGWTDAGDAVALESRMTAPIPPLEGQDWDFLGRTTVADLEAAIAEGYGSRSALGTETPAGERGAVSLVARAAVNAVAIARDLVARPGAPAAFALSFPLPGPGAETAHAVSFWLALLAAAAPRAPRPPVSFWAASLEGEWNRLLCFYQPPVRQRFLFIYDPAIRSDALYPIAEEDAAGRGAVLRDAGARRAAARLEDPGATLKEALDLAALMAAGARRPG